MPFRRNCLRLCASLKRVSQADPPRQSRARKANQYLVLTVGQVVDAAANLPPLGKVPGAGKAEETVSGDTLKLWNRELSIERL